MEGIIDNKDSQTLIEPIPVLSSCIQAERTTTAQRFERVENPFIESSDTPQHIKGNGRNTTSGRTSSSSRKKVVLSHFSQATGEFEWYTPERFILSAVECMGCIDLDPASCAQANRTVGAAAYYSKENSGLDKEWFGNVWLNPPYAAGLIRQFVEVAASKYEKGEFVQACALVNNASDTTWYHRLLNVSSAICMVKGRVKFIDKKGMPSSSPLQGQTAFYLGNHPKAFCEAFKIHGKTILL